MNVETQIKDYIDSLPELKGQEIEELHNIILDLMPDCKLWFLDGKNSENKTVSNPNIGYGHHTIKYANGETKEFYKIGISANKTGISVYVFGIEDKSFLAENFADKIGKAIITGYCIKFKTLKNISIEILKDVIKTVCFNQYFDV